MSMTDFKHDLLTSNIHLAVPDSQTRFSVNYAQSNKATSFAKK